jgi:hypothetical protein
MSGERGRTILRELGEIPPCKYPPVNPIILPFMGIPRNSQKTEFPENAISVWEFPPTIL